MAPARTRAVRTIAGALLAAGAARGQSPDPIPAPLPPARPPEIVLIRRQEPQPPPPQPPQPPDTGATTGAAPAPTTTDTGATTGAARAPTSAASQGTPAAPAGVGASTETTVPNAAPAGGTTSAINGAAGQAGIALGATDVSQLLTKSAASTGVEVQRRNAVIGDARVRGWRTGQYAVYGDGGYYLPARLDLDTAVSKFNATSLRDVVVVKGPYSVLYGPAFSVLSVNTLDAPRYNSFESHGRTSLGFQTNGQQWDALQSVWAGDQTWGFRATYNYLQGNNYLSGNGTSVPASYLSNNVNFALGLNLTANSTLEIKGLRTEQNNLQFPGLYFDVSGLDTTAFSAKYTLDDQVVFDRFTFTTWYNSTAGSGDTRGGDKQAFVQQLLFQSFNPTFPAGFPMAAAAGSPTTMLFRDFSTTRFAETSLGYTAAFNWGPKENPWLTAGTDLRVVGQHLVENINFQQLQGPNVMTGLPVLPGQGPTLTQTQTIPGSNAVDPGLFLQGRYALTDALTLNGGTRIDWVRASSNSRLITGNIDLFGSPAAPGSNINRFVLDPSVYSVHPGDTDLTRNYALLAGYLQAQYQFDPHLTGMLGVGHSERAPTLTELYAAGPFIGVLQQGTSRLIGDPSLSPEKLTQLDVGLRTQHDFFQAGVNGFYGWVNDYITYDANKTGNGLTQVVYTNTNLATLAGGEMFAQLDLTAWMTPFATVSYVQGIDQTVRDHRRSPTLASSRRDSPVAGVRVPETEPLPQIPPLESRLGFRLHTPSVNPWWQVEFSARVVAGQNNVAANLGELATPGFTVFTIRGFVRIRDQWLLTAGVDNLGNKNYREHLDPIAGNLLGVGPLFRPGTNFTFGVQRSY
jgi:iron complex outermembrane receptor protein